MLGSNPTIQQDQKKKEKICHSKDLIEANIRCYSCAPCHEFEHFAGDLSYFERDCFLDRSCMKITGTARDEYGYEREALVSSGCESKQSSQEDLAFRASRHKEMDTLTKTF
eukprot:TCALIF_03460-PA protein Name:"Protein of unknown function" AED:0.52 eAED:0.52 QI:0/0.33/0/0.5/0.33/0.25/4/0/110